MLDFNLLPKVTIDFMNDDHEEAVAIVNAFQQGIENGDVHAVEFQIKQLIEHCEAHFGREEACMRQHSFPPYLIHKQEHDRVLMELNMIAQQLKQHQDVEKIRSYAMQEFPAWFAQHLNTMDKMTAQYLSMQSSVGTEPEETTLKIVSN